MNFTTTDDFTNGSVHCLLKIKVYFNILKYFDKELRVYASYLTKYVKCFPQNRMCSFINHRHLYMQCQKTESLWVCSFDCFLLLQGRLLTYILKAPKPPAPMLPPEGFCPAPNKSLTIGLTPENSSYVIAKSLLVVVLSPLH